MALAEYNRVHPIPPATLRRLLPEMAADVRGWLSAYDADGDSLPERDRPRVTGYDLDILSYWYFDGMHLDQRADIPALERVDFASFVFANASAVAELARVAGDSALAEEFTAIAERIRAAVLANLWDDQTKFFYPQRASDNARAPLRELHGFFPFMTLLAPDEPALHRRPRGVRRPDRVLVALPAGDHQPAPLSHLDVGDGRPDPQHCAASDQHGRPHAPANAEALSAGRRDARALHGSHGALQRPRLSRRAAVRPAVAAKRPRVLLEMGAVRAVGTAEGLGDIARLSFDVRLADRRGRRRSHPAPR
jgi:hypothetical protein